MMAMGEGWAGCICLYMNREYVAVGYRTELIAGVESQMCGLWCYSTIENGG